MRAAFESPLRLYAWDASHMTGSTLPGSSATARISNARERQRLKRAFSGYVSPLVLQEILDGRLQPGIGATWIRASGAVPGVVDTLALLDQSPR